MTPGGQRLFAWDGRGDGAALAARAAERLPGWRGEVDLALGADAAGLWPDARRLDPTRLATGQAVQLDGALKLVRLGTGQTWTLELQYGRFRTYLPDLPGSDEQAQLAALGAGDPLTLLKAPGPGTGAWPTPEFLSATHPQIVLWPEETTYPPATAAALEAQGPTRVEPDTVVEAVTDGNRLWLRQWHGAGRR